SSAVDMLALVAEGDVVIMNTWANGRDNQEQGGSIVICAFIVALGESFTFDQQNDTWDTYIGPNPDERGWIHLRGALVQYRHGYVHRSNNGGTGYLKDYDWDERLQYWNIGLFPDEPPLVDPPELDFGEVVVGESVWDTLKITPVVPSSYSGTITPQPFSVHPSIIRLAIHSGFRSGLRPHKPGPTTATLIFI
ncbi:hypothetical protein KKC97_04795, partial [bacterium]|nr:hypothetical protein [bacterium]